MDITKKKKQVRLVVDIEKLKETIKAIKTHEDSDEFDFAIFRLAKIDNTGLYGLREMLY